jgi:hypothetical protein
MVVERAGVSLSDSSASSRSLASEGQPLILVNNRSRRSIHEELAVTEQQLSITQTVNRGQIMRDENDRAAVLSELGDTVQAFGLKCGIPQRQDFIQQADVGIQVGCDGKTQPHIHDFFELGGHSLLVLQMIDRIRRIFELELPVRSVFDEPTIEVWLATCKRRKRWD